MPIDGALTAAGWGALGASALLLGSTVGYLVDVPRRVIAWIMAFGSGVLISALTFDLMEDAYARDGFTGATLGFLAGSGIYTGVNMLLARRGARHRKRSGELHPPKLHHGQRNHGDPGLAIAVGSILDGIPESIAIGLTLIGGGPVSVVTVSAVFLSNVPEGLSSAAGMKRAGRSRRYIFGIWIGAIVVCAVAAFVGFAAFDGLPGTVVSGTTALAAGAILAMLVDTMIPEAYDGAHDFAGLITALGFVTAFVVTKLG